MQFSPGVFTKHASSSIAVRGRSYIRRVSIISRSIGEIIANVQGTHTYKTSIIYKKGAYVDSCSCPYGATCKHTIALAYVIAADPELKRLIEWVAVQDNVPFEEEESDDDEREKSDEISLIKQAYRKIVQGYHSGPLITPPPVPKQKTLLDVLGNLSRLESSHAVAWSKKEQRIYYILSKTHHQSWDRDSGKTHLAIEVGKAERSRKDGSFMLGPTQNIRDMYGRGAAYITKVDRKIFSLVAFTQGRSSDYERWNAVRVEELVIDELLRYLADNPLVFFDQGKKRQSLTVRKSPVAFVLELIIGSDGGRLFPKSVEDGIMKDIKIRELFDYTPPLVLTDNDELCMLDTNMTADQLRDLVTSPPIPLDHIHTPATMMAFMEASQRLPIVLPNVWKENAVDMTPVPVMTIHAKEIPWTVSLSYSYSGVMINHGSPVQYISHDDPDHPIGRRNIEAETGAINELTRILGMGAPWKIHPDQHAGLFTKVIPSLPSDWNIYLEKEERLAVSRSNLTYDFETTSGIDWLDITGSVKIDDHALALHDMLDEVFTGEPLVKLNGRYHVLPDTLVRMLGQLQPLKKKKDPSIRLHRMHVGLIDDFSSIISEDNLHDSWKQTLHAVRHFDGIKNVPISSAITATLRPYQRHGVNFLHYLRTVGFGGILADDMGLGKTLQTLTLLAHVHPGATYPSLIVAPTSVVTNWQRETAQFAKKLRLYLYAGKGRILPSPDSVDLIVTSYPLLWRDISILQPYAFYYVILDEAQYIKNAESETAKAARLLQAEHRLSLTGTPMENSVTELFSQFSFLNPGLFGTAEDFKTQYATPIERNNNIEVKKRLHKLITPFFLRRTKGQVLTDLPPKIEQTVELTMEQKQRDLYDAVKMYYQTKLLHLVDQQGIAKSQIQILEALLRLRQICCDPQLLKLTTKRLDLPIPAKFRTTESVKRVEVLRLVKEVVAAGHSVLLFSQFVQMLDILRDECKQDSLPVRILTGQTKDRQKLVEAFQKDKEATVFLISLKAGGTGLNLTAADYVIHYDPWWNPAVELQATDRTHRIGQTKSVNVYKMIVKDSIEEKILALQQKKKGLIDDLITTTAVTKRVTREDLAYLLS